MERLGSGHTSRPRCIEMTSSETENEGQSPPGAGKDGVQHIDGLYARPGFKIRRAHQTAVAIFATAGASLGVTTTQFGILYCLSQMSDLDQAGLASLVGLDRSTTGLVLDLLERRGCVVRVMHEQDRRRRVLSLTQEGRMLFARTGDPAKRAVQLLFGSTSQEDATRFIEIMDHLVTASTEGPMLIACEPMRGLHRRPGFLIRRAHQISTGLFVRDCRAFEITPTQFGALYALKHCPGLDQVSLARLVYLDRSTTAKVVGLLETRGLVERHIDAGDRRRRVLNLTDAGNRLYMESTGAAQAAVEHLMQPISADERHFLLAMLDSIVERNAAEKRPRPVRSGRGLGH
jgi:DNA-binding MarR family transcriptional regulator